MRGDVVCPIYTIRSCEADSTNVVWFSEHGLMNDHLLSSPIQDILIHAGAVCFGLLLIVLRTFQLDFVWV